MTEGGRRAEGSDVGGGGAGGEQIWLRHPNLLIPQPATTNVKSLLQYTWCFPEGDRTTGKHQGISQHLTPGRKQHLSTCAVANFEVLFGILG
eukprot:gene26238-biopygen15174